MHPSVHAAAHPEKTAVIVAETGETISYGDMEAASNRAAQLFRAHGLGHEDVVAFMLDNTPHYYGLTWGAQRAGLRYVCISSRLTQDETDYILENSGAKILIVSASLAPAALALTTGGMRLRVNVESGCGASSLRLSWREGKLGWESVQGAY